MDIIENYVDKAIKLINIAKNDHEKIETALTGALLALDLAKEHNKTIINKINNLINNDL